MSERGVVAMWCGGVRSVTDGWPCRSSWRVVGRLMGFCGGFGVVDDGGFRRGRGRGRGRGWARGRLAVWALGVAAHSLSAGLVAAAPMSSTQPSNVRAQQPCPARARTQTDRHAHTPALIALQPASPPARPPSRPPAIAAAVPLGSSHCVRSVRSCSSSGRRSWRRRRRRPSLMLQSSRVGFGHVCTYHLD